MKRGSKFECTYRWILSFALLFMGSFSGSLHADLNELLEAEEKKREHILKRFQQFTGDKNVMGETRKADGSVTTSTEKGRFDRDSGNVLSFQSDLTYHARAWNEWEEIDDPDAQPQQQSGAQGQSPPKKDRKLHGWISDHGKPELNDSSALERAVYSNHEKYSELEEKKPTKAEKGVRYESIFKITTKEVTRQDNKKATGNSPVDDKISVKRYEMREDVKEEVAQVGEDAAGTVIDVSKGEEESEQQDPQTFADGTLLREAANKSLIALKVSTLRGLSQRRIYNAAATVGGQDVKISEGVPNCGEWSAQVEAELAEVKDPDRRKDLQKQLKRARGQCNELARADYKRVNLRYDTPPNDPNSDKEVLQSKGVDTEDSRERDLRVQANVLDNFGLGANQVQNNWQYNEQATNGTVALAFDDQGNVTEERRMSPREQLDLWAEQKAAAKEGVDRVNQALPPEMQMRTDALTQGTPQAGQQAAWEITKMPEHANEYYGVSGQAPATEYNNYQDIVGSP